MVIPAAAAADDDDDDSFLVAVLLLFPRRLVAGIGPGSLYRYDCERTIAHKQCTRSRNRGELLVPIAGSRVLYVVVWTEALGSAMSNDHGGIAR
jgi:hypothetical protein